MQTDRKQAHHTLASLRVGDRVTVTRDGRTNVFTVTRELRPMDGNGFGSWDHSAVTVGNPDPRGYRFEVTPAAMADGRLTLTVGE